MQNPLPLSFQILAFTLLFLFMDVMIYSIQGKTLTYQNDLLFETKDYVGFKKSINLYV
jgi:hypothetical protein